MIIPVLLLFTCVISSNAFTPSSVSSLSSSATHESITRCAFATITNEYIRTRFGIQIPAPIVTNGICPLSFFTQLKNIFPQIKNRGGNTYTDWENTLNYIVTQNSMVDVIEQTDASRHVDSESFIPASSIILERYRLAIQALSAYDYEEANQYFGKMSHTLQVSYCHNEKQNDLDFYSHSNWIEMNRREPQPDLGRRVMTTNQFAGPTVRTCRNCATGSTAVCYSNNDVTKGLTSGYFSIGFDIFRRKPYGKCSHGGLLDATTDNDAIGGINKDSLSSIHGYLHKPAAQTAYLATCKILRQLRANVVDITFGRFLNILPRYRFLGRSISRSSSSFVYTTILNNLRKADSFTRLQQYVSSLAKDSYYKAHILSIAAAKHVVIDLLCQKNIDFDQDLSKVTGGLYLLADNQTQVNINRNKQMELIDILYSKRTSDNILITIDPTCTSLFLEFITNNQISLIIRLKNGKRIISPSSIITNTGYYKSYSFDNLTNGTWKLVFSTSMKSTFDLRVSCISEFRCFSHLYVDNENSIHPGVVELEGNLIQGKNAFLITTCDDHIVPMNNMYVTMIDDTNGNILGNSLQSIHDMKNDHWITNLTSIGSKSFRLKYFINNQAIKRLSRVSYQPSLIDVEVTQIDTSVPNKTIIRYRLFNYHHKSVIIKFIAKNIGTYIENKTYSLKADEIRDDQIEFNQETKAVDMVGNMLALTVSHSGTDWNYDIISL